MEHVDRSRSSRIPRQIAGGSRSLPPRRIGEIRDVRAIGRIGILDRRVKPTDHVGHDACDRGLRWTAGRRHRHGCDSEDRDAARSSRSARGRLEEPRGPSGVRERQRAESDEISRIDGDGHGEANGRCERAQRRTCRLRQLHRQKDRGGQEIDPARDREASPFERPEAESEDGCEQDVWSEVEPGDIAELSRDHRRPQRLEEMVVDDQRRDGDQRKRAGKRAQGRGQSSSLTRRALH